MFFLKNGVKPQLLSNLKKIFQNPKTHDFKSLKKDADYFVGFQKHGQFATLTTTERIEVGETIILNYKNKSIEYYAEAIDRYWNSNRIKTVWLKKISFYPEKVTNQLETISLESRHHLT